MAYSMFGYSHRFHLMMYIPHHCFLPSFRYDIILLPLPLTRYLLVYIPDRRLLCSWFVSENGSHYAVVATRFQAHQEGGNSFLPPPALQFLFHLLYLRHPYVADSFDRNLKYNLTSRFNNRTDKCIIFAKWLEKCYWYATSVLESSFLCFEFLFPGFRDPLLFQPAV